MKIGWSTWLIGILAVGMLGLAAFLGKDAIVSLFAGENVENRLYETGLSFEYSADSRPLFYSPNNAGFFHVTKNGVKFLNPDGYERMSAMYSMVAPNIVADGEYISVAENRGNWLYVYNSGGELYEVQVDEPIVGMALNNAGYSAAITRKGEAGYGVSVFNPKGALQSGGVLGDANSYPLCADISDDGRILAFAYLDVNEVQMNSKINFIYITQTDSIDIKDGIYAANTENRDQVIGSLVFMEKNKLLAVSDSEIRCYDANNGGAILWKMPLPNEVSAFCTIGKNAFALAYDTPRFVEGYEKRGTVCIYNMDLLKIGTFDGGGRVTQLTYGFDTLIVGANRAFYGITTKGDTLWTYNAPMDVFGVSPVARSGRLVITGNSRAVMLEAQRRPVDAVPVETDGDE